MAQSKTISLRYDLYYILGLSALVAVSIFRDDLWLHYPRLILGMPFLLFFPGYTLIAALFPKKDDLKTLERIVLSFGLSVAVVPLLGLGLNYTSWGIRLTPLLLSLLVFITMISFIALYRRMKLPPGDLYLPAVQVNLPEFKEFSTLEKALSGLLSLTLLFAVVIVFYVTLTPKTGESFTEFYILGANSKAENYPLSLAVLENGQVTACVVNHEKHTKNYFIQMKMGGYEKSRTGPITLDHGQKWEDVVKFSALEPHENLKVEFLLFREDDPEPYRSLHLWLTVHK